MATISNFILTAVLAIAATAVIMFGIVENLRVMERVHSAVDELEKKTERLEKVEKAIETYSKSVSIETSESIINYLEEK